MSYFFHRTTIIFAACIISALAFFYVNPLHLHFEGPAERLFEDFDYSDVVFSDANMSAAPVDTNIVIIDAGYADIYTISAVLTQLARLEPKAIGLDIIYDSITDSSRRLCLQRVMAGTPNLVAGKELIFEDKHVAGFWGAYAAHSGYTNFNARHNDVVRYFCPFMEIEGNWSYATDTSFTANILKLADSTAFRRLCDRHNAHEVINYRRNMSRYEVYTCKDFLSNSFVQNATRNKIVLIGYCNQNSFDIEDKHFTPANKIMIGKSLPDTYGVVIHANILSMMLGRGDYINTSPQWLNLVLAALLIWLFLGTFIRYSINKSVWFHVMMKLIGAIMIISLLSLDIIIFKECHYKMELGVALWGIPLSAELYLLFEAIGEWKHHRANKKSQLKITK